ncbi:hypothetical protein ACR6C2_37720 [Streptomyces sp. INA 01156]
MGGQDRAVALNAWRTALDGLEEPTLLVPDDSGTRGRATRPRFRGSCPSSCRRN